ncbi:hypothetical protein [Rhodoferax sp. BAB1]|uniref:hypothetical protein n=1 Tax=Rhodoferax sp. BAB1 TaxID=2741720 RepID=UPI0015772C32|nr:hypothetical protein [Rhodoferax sp. BAB1]QKO21255.1 hypothetical protein HTY51_04830 [Rhodoferax sp. BAB1]
MKKPLLISLTATFFVAGLAVADLAQAQGRIYRCGNEYTNTLPPGQKGCKLLEGGNVTVVQRPRATESVRMAAANQAVSRLEGERQRQRDADARMIIESELRKAEARQAELVKEYNNGEPEKMGPEFRNHQKYLDRVADLKASIERNESDLAGLRRELDRLPEASVSESK